MTTIYKKILNEISNKFGTNEIKKSDMNLFKDLINFDNIHSLLNNILEDDQLLEKLAKRSYSHTLGFDKIVLVDLSKDVSPDLPKVQLRLHIWEPDNLSVPIVESLHEHSFDFVSLILTGKLENQVFQVSDVEDKYKPILSKIKDLYKKLSQEDKVFINEQIEIIEAIKLKEKISFQLDELNMLENYDIEKLTSITGLTESECFDLASIQGRYVSNRVRGENKEYKHIFEENKLVYPLRVEHHGEGEYYFHSYVNPHRLYYDNTVINSTMLITTPTPLNPQGGSFQRPTYIEDSEINYNKIKIDVDAFRMKIEKIRNIIKNKELEGQLQ